MRLSRRNFLASGAAGTLAALGGRGVRAESDRPNILFFLSDDQRHDVLGCAGHPILQTPVVDRLAARGVRFSDCCVTTPICPASRASILTGVTERTHGYTFGRPPVPAPLARASYPRALRRSGYRTAFFGKYGVAMETPPEDLFDVHEFRDRPYFQNGRHIDELNAEGAIRFLEEHDAAAPFCMSISFSTPHAEDADLENHFPAIDGVAGLYEDVEMPPPRLADPAIFDAHPEFLRESLNRERYYWRWDTPEKYQRNMRAYLRMITGMDLLIGRVLDALAARGLAERTVVVFCSDNGYYMGDRGFTGKWSHYEESLRVPLIVMDPRLPAGLQGRVLDPMTLNLDLPATFLDLAGLPAPDVYQGRSLVPWMRGETPSWRTSAFLEHRMNHPAIPKWEGVRTARHTYARYDEQEPIHEFLHDREADPDQIENLAASPEQREVLEHLRRACDAYAASYAPALD